MPRRLEATANTLKVGARIRELRLGRNMSLGELANVAAISKGHLSSVEHGLAAITAETVERIAKALGLPPLYVFTFIEENDERAKIAEVIMDFPLKDLVQLRKDIMTRRKALLAQSGEGKGSKRTARREA